MFDATGIAGARLHEASNGKEIVMRHLGPSSLATFWWDLTYLLAQLSTDERPGIADLALPVETAMNVLRARRAEYEKKQEDAVIAQATVGKRDKGRDRLLLQMGGVARATGKNVYARLFPKLSPSRTAKLGVDAESVEVLRILAELKNIEATHPVRVGYEVPLQDAQAALEAAKKQADDAELALAVERSEVEQCKVDMDRVRLETHGKLIALLADKDEVEAFFRPLPSVTERPSTE